MHWSGVTSEGCTGDSETWGKKQRFREMQIQGQETDEEGLD